MLKNNMLGLLFGFFITSFCASAADGQPLKTYLQQLADSAAIPGMTFGLLEKDKSPELITVGFGDAQKQTVLEQNTIFEAASLSKPVLAYIVLRLVERGEISLDQPLYKTLQNERIKNQDWAKLITPRLVLSHQSGLPNWGRGELEFRFKPGSDFGYSGEGYVYLQKVLEKITGMSYQALAQKEVFKPLGMQDSYFTWSKSDVLKLAKGHDRAGQRVSRDIPEVNAAASLHTTAADYLKFIDAWFDTKRLSAKSRHVAFDSATEKSKVEPGDTHAGGLMGWGLGWGIYESGQSKLAWHWGDNGVFRAFVAIEPKSQKAFVYFANSQNGLAIAKQVSEKVFPGNQGMIDWLGYGQADSALWQAERQGYEHAAQGKYKTSIQFFNQVLAKFPDNRRLKNKIKWMQPFIDKPQKKLVLSKALLNKLAGQYGERKLFVDKGVLKYQRNQGKIYTLAPFYDNVLTVGELTDVRLEVVFDDNDNPVKLVALYEGGWRDESERSGD